MYCSSCLLKTRRYGLPHTAPSRYSSLPDRMPFTIKSRLTPSSFLAVTSLRVAPLRFHSPYSAISDLSDDRAKPRASWRVGLSTLLGATGSKGRTFPIHASTRHRTVQRSDDVVLNPTRSLPNSVASVQVGFATRLTLQPNGSPLPPPSI